MKLSIKSNSLDIGCIYKDSTINYVYAHDMCVFCLSRGKGDSQKLINVCVHVFHVGYYF